MADENVIAAFSEDHVERLTGITKAQLRYWDRTGFFVPSYADENRRAPFSRIYSFRDIAALRVVHALRNQNNIPLQHLRKVAARLAHLEDAKWTGTTLWVLGKKVIFQEPGEPRPKEIVSGQFVLDLPLKKIVTATRQDIKRLLTRPRADIGGIEQSRYVNHNAWVVKGTRVPTRAIRRFHAAGYTIEQIIGEYPDLTPEDIEAALRHYPSTG